MSKSLIALASFAAMYGNTPALNREPEPYYRKSTIPKDERKARTKHKKQVKKSKHK
jgi:hypothetical protein